MLWLEIWKVNFAASSGGGLRVFLLILSCLTAPLLFSGCATGTDNHDPKDVELYLAGATIETASEFLTDRMTENGRVVEDIGTNTISYRQPNYMGISTLGGGGWHEFNTTELFVCEIFEDRAGVTIRISGFTEGKNVTSANAWAYRSVLRDIRKAWDQ